MANKVEDSDPEGYEEHAEILAGAIRRNPLQALVFLARQYRALAATTKQMQAPARVLFALAKALDQEDYDSLRGPTAWAKAYLRPDGRAIRGEIIRRGKRIPIVSGPLMSEGMPERIQAARSLEALALERKAETSMNLAWHARVWFALVDPETIGFGPPATSDLDELQRRIAAAIEKVRSRKHYTSEHVAIAMLVGWGMNRDAARNVFKKA